MKITTDDLMQNGAENLERFAARWPEGMIVTEEAVREAAEIGVRLEDASEGLRRSGRTSSSGPRGIAI